MAALADADHEVPGTGTPRQVSQGPMHVGFKCVGCLEESHDLTLTRIRCLEESITGSTLWKGYRMFTGAQANT